MNFQELKSQHSHPAFFLGCRACRSRPGPLGMLKRLVLTKTLLRRKNPLLLLADMNNRRHISLTSEEMQLMARYASLDDSMTASEVRRLRALRDSVDEARWEDWLKIARCSEQQLPVTPELSSFTEEERTSVSSTQDPVLRRLEVAKCAALLAAAALAREEKPSEADAECHLRDFASIATEVIEKSSTNQIPSFRDAFAQHLRARSSLFANKRSSSGPPREHLPPAVSSRSTVFPTEDYDELTDDTKISNTGRNYWSSSSSSSDVPRQKKNNRFQAWR